MSWIWSALMPHPPVLLHEIGRGREIEAIKTLNGIKNMTAAMKKTDLLFVLSPHQPYSPGALFVNSAITYHGSFALFGLPHVGLDIIAENSYDFCLYLESSGTIVHKKAFEDLTNEQGSMVPLYFLNRVWGELPPVIISSPIGLTPKQEFSIGQSLAIFQSKKSWPYFQAEIYLTASQ